MEPVLDIGCGKQGNLVRFLQQKNIATFGLDRFSFESQNLISSDWLEYCYGLEKWETIISNLGFSNHFKHHHQREDVNYIGYAQKYMGILNSLKTWRLLLLCSESAFYREISQQSLIQS